MFIRTSIKTIGSVAAVLTAVWLAGCGTQAASASAGVASARPTVLRYCYAPGHRGAPGTDAAA